MRPLFSFLMICALFVWDIVENGGRLFAELSPLVNGALAGIGLL
jgi:hypothetical protein